MCRVWCSGATPKQMCSRCAGVLFEYEMQIDSTEAEFRCVYLPRVVWQITCADIVERYYVNENTHRHMHRHKIYSCIQTHACVYRCTHRCTTYTKRTTHTLKDG